MRFMGSALGIGRLIAVSSLSERVVMKVLMGVFVGSDESGVGVGDHVALSRIIVIVRHGGRDRGGQSSLSQARGQLSAVHTCWKG